MAEDMAEYYRIGHKNKLEVNPDNVLYEWKNDGSK